MNPFELHPERLGTIDAEGKRTFVYPADVRGRYRNRRAWMRAVLINVFLWLPWIKLRGRPLILLDIVHRHFEIFGLSLRAHNAPILVFVLAIAGFGLFFVTSIWGRIWCGWACPQTVFVEGVFRRIERWIDGSHLEQRRLAEGPWTVAKFRKRFLKWSLFILCAAVITHSFLAYFVGTDQLREMVFESPLRHWTAFLFILFATAILLFDFAWFREQFCVIVCPYGRFQSVLMDSQSLVITYDTKRGEPRHTPQLKAAGAPVGDCVNCYRCVQVCPCRDRRPPRRANGVHGLHGLHRCL